MKKTGDMCRMLGVCPYEGLSQKDPSGRLFYRFLRCVFFFPFMVACLRGGVAIGDRSTEDFSALCGFCLCSVRLELRVRGCEGVP